MRVAVFLIIFLRASFLFCGEYSSLSGAEALNLETGGRTAGLGKAFTALADDPQALFYNPAGLGQLNRPAFSISHTALFSELSAQSVLANYPLGPGSAGAGIHYIHSGTFSEIVNGQETGNAIGYSSLLLMGAYGMRISRLIQAGFEIKFLSTDLAGTRGTAVACDAGILLGLEAGKFYNRIENNLRFGLSFQNFGSRIKFIEKSERLPERIRLGVSYKPLPLAVLSVDGSTWTGYSPERSSLFCFGLEFLSEFYVTPRLGLSISHDEAEFAAGFGAGSSWKGLNCRFDLSYSGAGDLGSRIFLSLTLKETPFYQYRDSGIRQTERPLPAFLSGRSGSGTFLPEEESRERLKVRLAAGEAGSADTEELLKAFRTDLAKELEKSDDIVLAENEEDILVAQKIMSEEGKYRLDVKVTGRGGALEIKKFLVRFTAAEALGKISRRIADSVKQDVLPSLFGGISIRTAPAGGEIYIREKLTGQTPYDTDRFPSGGHMLRIEKKGYGIIVTNIMVKPEVRNDFFFTLRPEGAFSGVFNLVVADEAPSKDTENLSQAFEMLLAENLELFKEYVRMDPGKTADIKTGYSFEKKGGARILSIKITEIKTGRIIEGLKYSMEKDEKLVEAVHAVLNSVVESAMKSGRKSEALQRGFLSVRTLSPGMEIFLDDAMIRTPFQQVIGAGRHSLLVRDDEDILSSYDFFSEAGKTNSVLLFRHFKDDFGNGPDGRLWNTGGSDELKISRGRLLFSAKKNEKKEIFLESRDLPALSFEASVKLKSVGVPGSEFYFGVQNERGAVSLIRFDGEAYTILSRGLFSAKETKHGLITRFGDEEKREYELKIVYSPARVHFYADGLPVGGIPLKESETVRIILAGVSKQGMLFGLSGFRLNLMEQEGL